MCALILDKSSMPKTFRVNYRTNQGKGSIMIYVGSFFGKNRLSVSDKFLSFARFHSTREQQLALLAILEEEKQVRTSTERERIEKVIKKINAQAWGTKQHKK